MGNKAYLVTLDTAGFIPITYQTLHRKLTEDLNILSWWHHLESAYILIVPSKFTSKQIAEYVKGLVPNRMFFVVEVKLGTREGMLTPEAWAWIEKWKDKTDDSFSLLR
jgi:hypothetical protein